MFNHYQFLAQYAGVRQLARVLAIDSVTLLAGSWALTILAMTHDQHHFVMLVLALASVFHGACVGIDIHLLQKRLRLNRRIVRTARAH